MESPTQLNPKCPHNSTSHPYQLYKGGGCKTTKQKKTKHLTILACFSAFFAAFSASFCCFFRAFFDWACCSSSVALKQEEMHNKHFLWLPPPISCASHEEVIDRLGKLILNHHHLQPLSMHYFYSHCCSKQKLLEPVLTEATEKNLN